MDDYKNFQRKKYEEKLDAFAGCVVILLIMFLLVAIGAVSEQLFADTPVYVAGLKRDGNE